jgi:epoxyqueuosine reductase
MISGEGKIRGDLIRKEAFHLGFDLIGIVPSRKLDEHKDYLHSWLEKKMNADMSFLSRDQDKRIDPGVLLQGAKSVIVTGLNYFPPVTQMDENTPVISKYAYGEDYHSVIKDKLTELLNFIISLDPSASGKICVDSSPVLEKAWAHEAGLGWIGRNSLLINSKRGSFIFLGEIILNIELESQIQIQPDNCGNCSLCINACPTGAINDNRTINAGKCISWLTVENKSEIPGEFKGKLKKQIFGCDICQDVCPWNKDIASHNNNRFRISDNVRNMSLEEWQNLDLEKFEKLFSKSPLRRTGYKKIVNNIKFVTD